MSNFLPSDYEAPESGNDRYMRLEEGDNAFRVLDSAIVGYELWVEGKPLRRKKRGEFTPGELARADVSKFTGEKKTPQLFWAFPVFNRKAQGVQILEITQRTIQSPIEALVKDESWGSPVGKDGYDLVISRTGEGTDTTYTVMPKPHKTLEEGIMRAYEDMNIDLQALFSGDDPFGSQVDVDEVPEDLS